MVFLGGVALLYFILVIPQQVRSQSPSSVRVAEETQQIKPSADLLQWQRGKDGWVSTGDVPPCSQPLELNLPVDVSLATSVLYPGQYRGGHYKPHGGFRFDAVQDNHITVQAPMGAWLVDGSQYLVEGEVQYAFDFISPCGIWYRLGHLRELAPLFEYLAYLLPEAREGDSRTYALPRVWISEGEVIATQVGFRETQNVFVDWGVYDLRSSNQASRSATWSQKHPGEQEQHAVCWFDLLTPSDETAVRSLPPSDSTSGSTSDYCE